MFNIKKFLAENKLTEASQIDEAYGKRLGADDVYDKAWHQVLDAVTTVHSYMVKLERDGELSRSDPKVASAYRAVKQAGVNVHKELKKWKSVMESMEKVKHQQRGK